MKVSGLTGYSGVGKTTLVKRLITLLRQAVQLTVQQLVAESPMVANRLFANPG